MEWIDTHCHLNEDAFTSDRAEAVQRAVDAGVKQMLVIGITLDSSRRAVELAQQFSPVFAVVGIQPNYVQSAGPGDLEEIAQLATASKVVGIGETGLDRYWDHAPIELQRELFERHLDLSRQLDLPFVVHCRDAEADVVALLQRAAQSGPLRGVMHSFAGNEATAQACLALGMHVSFSGMLTYKRHAALREVAKLVPDDRLLVETDAPYLSPSPLDRGKRNEPVNVRITAGRLAEVRNVRPEVVAQLTTSNARTLFRLPNAM